jgi:cation diffusion facilitator family transporter
MHVLGDLLNSVGVIIAALIIYFFGQETRIADPIVTFVFTLIILRTSYPTLKSGVLTLMEATPDEVDHEKLEVEIRKIEGVEDVHDLHVWALTSGKNACSAHITSHNPFETLKRVQKELTKTHNMMHVTIQIEPPHSESPESRHEHHFNCDNKLHKNIHKIGE